jgi:hypothetical protein
MIFCAQLCHMAQFRVKGDSAIKLLMIDRDKIKIEEYRLRLKSWWSDIVDLDNPIMAS